MDENQKKIVELRKLLAQAKNRIDSLKNNLVEKDKQLQQCRNQYEKKVKLLENDSSQIMKQYQERLLRYQKSLQQSDALVSKYQKQSQNLNKNYQDFNKTIGEINNIIVKVFTFNISKDNNQAVDQLCNVQKCKQFQQRLEKLQDQNKDSQILIKSIKKLNGLYEDSLKKKRQCRISLMKRQSNIQKNLQQEIKKHQKYIQKISQLQNKIKKNEQEFQKKIETIAKTKAKVSQQKTNLEFVKQLMIKIILGPKQASSMAFQVVSKVLKFTEEQYKTCIKKIK